MKIFIMPLILLYSIFCDVRFMQQNADHIEVSINDNWTSKGLGAKLDSLGTDRTPGDIWAKLEEKNILFVSSVGINYPERRFDVMIEGRQQYIDENAKNIKKIANEVIQSTKYKDYSIHVNKSFTINYETSEQFKELNIEEIKRSLKDKGYKEVQRVLKETETNFVSINILTNIRSNGSIRINYGKEIEKEIRKIIAKEMETLKTNNVLIEVHVYDIRNEKII